MKIDFEKYRDGLVPAIIQDATTLKVLMLGFMDADAIKKTEETKLVTFFSRSKQKLWTKGEESKNYLKVVDIKLDCDNDALLILAHPQGPTCHTGADTCWDEENKTDYAFLSNLEKIIQERQNLADHEKSYVTSLFKSGINKIAQKVGEEAVEVVIEAKDENQEKFHNECADLLFHYLILLRAKGSTLNDIVTVLEKRHYNS